MGTDGNQPDISGGSLPMNDVPQSQFYRFEEFISENDLTQSWIATNLKSGKRCFLKIPSRNNLLPSLTKRDILLKSFLCQKNIKSSQVLCALAKHLEKGNIIIEYPYFDTARWKTLTPVIFWENFKTIFTQACMIVDFIHLLGYLHCDLKMENLVVNLDHGGVRTMIIDLDFLREDGQPLDAKIIGTPGMIAPEVMSNQTYSSKSDNFSIGMSLRFFIEKAESLKIQEFSADTELRNKLDSLIRELTLEDPLKRPSFLLDALRTADLLDDAGYDAFNRRLFSMQLLSNFKSELEYRIPSVGQLQRFLTEKNRIFGIPEDILFDLEAAFKADKKATLMFIRSMLKKARIKRYEDCWHIALRDDDLVSAFSELDTITGFGYESFFDHDFESEENLKKGLLAAEKFKNGRHFLKAYLLYKAIFKEFLSRYDTFDRETQDRFFDEMCKLAVSLNRKTEAIEILTEALGRTYEGSDRHFHITLDLIYQFMSSGKLDDALEMITHGLKLAEQFDNHRIALEFLRFKAWIISAAGDQNQSLQLLEQIEQEAREKNDHDILAKTYNYIATVYWRTGKYEKSQRYYEKSIKLIKSFTSLRETISSYVNMALVCFEISEYKKSIKYSRMVLQQLENNTELHGMPYIYSNLVLCYARIGEYNKALYWNQRLRSAGSSDYNQSDFSKYYFNAGWMSLMRGDYSAASQAFNKALNILAATQSGKYLGKIHFNLAELSLYEGEAERCTENLEVAKRVFIESDDSASLIECELLSCLNDIYNNSIKSIDSLLPILKDLIKAHSSYMAIVCLFHILIGNDQKLSNAAKALAKPLLTSIENTETPVHKAVAMLLKLSAEDAANAIPRINALKSAYLHVNEAGHFFNALLVARAIAHIYQDQSKDKLTAKFLLQASKLAETIKNRRYAVELNTQIERLTASEKSRQSSINMLHEISKILKDIGNYDMTLRSLIQFAVDETGAERGALLLRSDQKSKLQVKAYLNCDDESLKDITDFSHSVPQYAQQLGRPIIIDNALDDKRTKGFKSIIKHNIRSVICIPVYREKDIIGVLYLDHHTIPALFDDEDITIISSMANLISHMITTALKYKAIKFSREQLEVDLIGMGGKQPFITQDKKMLNLLEKLPEFAKSKANVLVLGESGTGKEILCQKIHEQSLRKDASYLTFDCAAIPEDLAESILFGIDEGIATNVKEKAGILQAADGGTLFMDEIGDMSPLVQSKILKVLDNQEFRKVGRNRPISVDVRFIFATNKNIFELVQQNKFRGDLLYRISTVTIEIPPLRERRDDIPLLIKHFNTLFAKGKQPPELSARAKTLLNNHDWPGNVRELRNLMERLCLMNAGQVVEIKDLPGNMVNAQPKRKNRGEKFDPDEKQMIIESLIRNEGNRKNSAKELGISYTTFLRKLKYYGVDADDYRPKK
jgi:Nif-specific regulatory protein